MLNYLLFALLAIFYRENLYSSDFDSKKSVKSLSDEYLKHLIIESVISILEAKETQGLTEKQKDEKIDLCIKTGNWKVSLSSEKLNDIENGVLEKLKKKDIWPEVSKSFPDAKAVRTFIENNPTIFYNIWLLHWPKYYYDKFSIPLETLAKNTKFESGYYYLYVSGPNKNTSTLENSNKNKSRFRELKSASVKGLTPNPTILQRFSSYVGLTSPDFQAEFDTPSPNSQSGETRIRYGNRASASPVGVGLYKIHLMPFRDDFARCVQKILNDDLLKSLIDSVKFRDQLKVGRTAGYTCPTQELEQNKFSHTNAKNEVCHTCKCLCGNKGAYDVGPLIVMYVSKDKFPEALNCVERLFEGEEGLNLTPQFNQKVSSLIYCSQGDSIRKIHNPELYQEPELIFYQDHIVSTALQKGVIKPREKCFSYYVETVKGQQAFLIEDSTNENRLNKEQLDLEQIFSKLSKENNRITALRAYGMKPLPYKISL